MKRSFLRKSSWMSMRRECAATVVCGLLCITSARGQDADTLPATAVRAVPFRVEVVATDLRVPWSIVFAPDGRMFFTERPGRLRVIENGKLREEPLLTLPDVDTTLKLGLMGMTLPPLRLFLGLAMPTPLGWSLVATGAGVVLLRGRSRSSSFQPKEEPLAPPEKSFT